MKTTVAQLGAVAQAMNEDFKRASAGEKTGTYRCRCGGQINFTAGDAPHKTTGRCSSTCGVKWANN